MVEHFGVTEITTDSISNNKDRDKNTNLVKEITITNLESDRQNEHKYHRGDTSGKNREWYIDQIP